MLPTERGKTGDKLQEVGWMGEQRKGSTQGEKLSAGTRDLLLNLAIPMNNAFTSAGIHLVLRSLQSASREEGGICAMRLGRLAPLG